VGEIQSPAKSGRDWAAGATPVVMSATIAATSALLITPRIIRMDGADVKNDWRDAAFAEARRCCWPLEAFAAVGHLPYEATHAEKDRRPARSKTFARLHFQELSVSRSARRFTRWLNSNACASSPSSTLHISLIENRWVPFPGTARASCARNVHRIFFRRRITHHKRICLCSTEPARLPRLLAACAASENVDTSRALVKQFCALA
jgi:hypothetical protein